MALSECRRNAAPRRAQQKGTCDACGQWGHQASTCNKVGAWAFLCYFHKDWINTSLIEEAKKAWIDKNKVFQGDGMDTPKKVFTTYCNRLGITEDQVIDKVD
jgi:acyl-homoserine lactone acylase PvdQ